MKKRFTMILLVLTAGLMSAFVSPSRIELNQTTAVQTAVLSNDEVAGLVFMREEEKLAYDLYTAFYEMYGLQAFQNIAGSELTHINAIKSLLALYAIPDSVSETQAGVFVDPVLQDLYDQLFAQGSRSLADAIKVGAAVEEIDILDLQTRSNQTEMVDILRVYENLKAGSENHLRVFTSILKSQTGDVYIPGFLSSDEYQRIISGTSGNGFQGRQGGRGNSGQRNS